MGTGTKGVACQAKGCGSWTHFVLSKDGTSFYIGRVALLSGKNKGRGAGEPSGGAQS